jgi:hypothetical protein
MYQVAPRRLGASGSTVDPRLAAAIALEPLSDGPRLRRRAGEHAAGGGHVARRREGRRRREGSVVGAAAERGDLDRGGAREQEDAQHHFASCVCEIW